MSGWELELIAEPDRRLDLSSLTPDRVAGRSDVEIGRVGIISGRDTVPVADLFKLRPAGADELRLTGLTERCDRVGQGMRDGVLAVIGDVGAHAGAAMKGGILRIRGSVGPSAASALAGGRMEISGDAGERLGGPALDEPFGMRGGVVLVRGDAGSHAGERLRRGLIVVGGDTGDYPGARMIAGTLVIGGAAGRFPGYQLRRGSLIFKREPKALLPTFVDCGVAEFSYLRLLQRDLRGLGVRMAFGAAARRLMGDMAAVGKGEILIGA